MPVFQWADFTQMKGKDVLDDHATTAWQAKIHDGMKWLEKSNLLSCRLVLKLITYTRTTIRFTPLALQNIVQALRNKQLLGIAHSQTHFWKTFQLCKICCFLVLGFEETDCSSSLLNGELHLYYPKLLVVFVLKSHALKYICRTGGATPRIC